VADVNSMGSLPPSKDLTCTGGARGRALASWTPNHPGGRHLLVVCTRFGTTFAPAAWRGR
jgi:hypothetical protein